MAERGRDGGGWVVGEMTLGVPQIWSYAAVVVWRGFVLHISGKCMYSTCLVCVVSCSARALCGPVSCVMYCIFAAAPDKMTLSAQIGPQIILPFRFLRFLFFSADGASRPTRQRCQSLTE